MGIMKFCEEIINGSGGLKEFEYYNMAMPCCDREVAVSAWVIRRLADPGQAGSKFVLDAIIKQRAGDLISRLEEIREEFCPMPIVAAEAAMDKYNDPCGCSVCALIRDLVVEEAVDVVRIR